MQAGIANLEVGAQYLAQATNEQWDWQLQVYRVAKAILARRHALEIHRLAIILGRLAVEMVETGDRSEPSWDELLAKLAGEEQAQAQEDR